MLYTVLSDSGQYLGAVIDSDYVASIVGSLRGSRIDDRIDVNHQPRTWGGVFPDPIPVTFPVLSSDDKSKTIPDIAEFQGRLFLNEKAYQGLKPVIENDGEFIPATVDGENGYIFTPLRKAEDVDGLDSSLSKKNEWEDVEHLAFLEDQVRGFNLFRAEYTACMRLYCQESFKGAVQNANLTGLYFSPDLANIFPEERASVTRIN